MANATPIDLGGIKIHRAVVCDVVAHIVTQHDGIRLVPAHWGQRLRRLVDPGTPCGIRVHIDKNNQVTVELHVALRFGVHLPEIAQRLQQAVRRALEQTVDIDLKQVQINIHRIERGEP